MSITSKIAGVVRAVSLKMRKRTGAVILAAGIGSRMGSDTTKQMMMLSGKPLFMWSVIEFDKCPYIDEIVLVCRKEEVEKVKEILAEYKIDKPVTVTEGGSTRQMSALIGFEKLSPKCKYVAIHDAARACVTQDIISDVVSEAYASMAASAVCHVYDTVKKVSASGVIEGTEDRDTLALGQTPQAFDTTLYRAAAYTALKNKTEVTDDNMLVELIGQKIKAVYCTKENFKITTPEDIAYAETILGRRNGEG